MSHKTIYNAIYMHPRGELKRELIVCLRQHNQVCKSRNRGVDRRSQIPDMQGDPQSRSPILKSHAIHIRHPEIEDHLIPSHWESDLIKGADQRFSVSTLGVRTTGFVVLAKMDNATTKSVINSLPAVLNPEPAAMRKTMTYGQSREMHAHKIFTECSNVEVYLDDPHSQWQRDFNENTNRLLRQYLSKGSDLSIYSQNEFDAIALRLTACLRAGLGIESTNRQFYSITFLQFLSNTIH